MGRWDGLGRSLLISLSFGTASYKKIVKINMRKVMEYADIKLITYRIREFREGLVKVVAAGLRAGKLYANRLTERFRNIFASLPVADLGRGGSETRAVQRIRCDSTPHPHLERIQSYS